jgi:hypothetical protein
MQDLLPGPSLEPCLGLSSLLHCTREITPQLRMQFPSIRVRHAVRACEDANLNTIAALHQGNCATIANYLERELRYMDAGE